MIRFPGKKIIGLIGAPRAGKDVVANYLLETRGFFPIAFADIIKEEFGISKEDFEAAKIAGNINELRQKLWDFSTERKKLEPAYFVKKVMSQVNSRNESVIITDIRTEEEFTALFDCQENAIKRIYFVYTGELMDSFERKGEEHKLYLKDSKLSYDFIKTGEVRIIRNNRKGVYKFYNELDNFFFTEDIMDLPGSQADSDSKITEQYRAMVSDFVSQFDIRQR